MKTALAKILLIWAFWGVSLVGSTSTSDDQAFFAFYGCTSLAVGRGATETDSTMISHGNDCPTCDFRVAYVPSMDHAKESSAPVWIDFDDYPRFIISDSTGTESDSVDVSFPQAEIYKTEFLEPGFEITTQRPPMGYISQVEHTFAYIDGAYGIMNEHALSIGESTCDAKLGQRGIPIEFGGNALFGIAQLSRFALQRCKTARCAIKLMGDLAVKYG